MFSKSSQPQRFKSLIPTDFPERAVAVLKERSEPSRVDTSRDVDALDLVLNEISVQARLATNAAGAIIGLRDDGELKCRARAGSTAEDVAQYLHEKSAIVALALRSATPQRCDDAVTDDRVDPLASRRLGFQSLLVVPIVNAGGVVGVIEVFSAQSNTFTERETLVLQALARRVLSNLEFVQMWTGPTTSIAVKGPQVVESIPRERFKLPSLHKDFPNGLVLYLCSLVLALVTGWMVGRIQVRSAEVRAPGKPKAAVNVSVPPATEAGKEKSEDIAVGSTTPTDAEAQPQPVPDTTSKSSGSAASQRSSSEASEGVVSPVRDTPATLLSTDPGIVRIPSETANQLLVHRVEPDYPEAALEHRIKGRVLVDVVVDAKGNVEQVRRLSGNAQLVGAATSAIQQWRFKTLKQNGKPAKFISTVAVNFVLP